MTDSEKEIVSKLLHPVEEIRSRALNNLLSKLEFGIVKLEMLADATDLIENLLKLISLCKDGQVIPELEKILKLLLVIIETTTYGRQIVLKHEGDIILQTFRANFESALCPTDSKILSTLLGSLLTRDKPSLDLSIQSQSSNLSVTSLSSSLSCYTPADIVANRSLPQYLLKSNLSKDGAYERIYSPVTRTYFNKKVTFNDDVSPQEDDDEEHFSVSVFGCDSLLHWQPLARNDREMLNRVRAGLTSHKPEEIRESCEQLTSNLLEHFHPEIFIQRPDLMFALQDLLLLNTNQALKSLAAKAIYKISEKLLQKITRLRDVNYITSKDTISNTVADDKHKSFGGSFTKSSDFDDEEEDESYADYINSTQLKERQLLVHEFCLLCLSNAAATFTNVTEFKALNASCQLFSSAKQLLTVVLDSCLHPNWYLINRGTSKNARDVLDEIACELFKGIHIHKKNEKSLDKSESRFHRLSHLIATKLSTEFIEKLSNILSSNVVLPNVSKLRDFLSQELCDVTLYLSHKSLHKRMYNLFNENEDNRIKFDEVKKLLRSLGQAVKLLKESQRPPSRSGLLKICNDAILTYPLYENLSIVSLAFGLCKSAAKAEKDLVNDTILKLLAFPDIQVKTSIYFELHSAVQGALGISHALDIDGSKLREISFLFIENGGAIFCEIVQFGMNHESKHIRQASEEILLYFLKAEKIMGPKLWTNFVDNVLRPNLKFLECFAATSKTTTLKMKDKKESDSRLFLANFIAALMSPDTDRQVIGGLSTFDLLTGNFRLLLSKNSEVRDRAQANLKCLLSQEKDSHTKLPRFSTIVETELRDFFAGVSFQVSKRTIEAAVTDEQVTTLKNLLGILNSGASTDSSLKRAALLKINIIIQNVPDLQIELVELGGLKLLSEYVDSCLAETDYTHPKELLPLVIQIYKSIVVHQNRLIRQELLRSDGALLFVMLRCAVLFPEDANVKRDLSILAVFILFSDVIIFDKNGGENPQQILLPQFFHQNCSIPIESGTTQEFSVHQIGLDLIEGKKLWGILDLLKTFWNLAWFGGSENLFKQVDTVIPSNLFSEKLQLSQKELTLAKNSFLDFNLESLYDQLKSSNKHSVFINHLQFVETHLLLKEEETSLSDFHRYFPMRESLGKYLTTKPNSYNDEKLFLEIVDFVTLMIKLSADINLPWFEYLVETVSIKSGVAFHFLSRNAIDAGSQSFMVAKGHEKVGHLLLTLTSKLTETKKTEFCINLLENVVRSGTILNLWLLKVVAALSCQKFNLVESDLIESRLIENFFSTIVDQASGLRWKPEVFDSSGIYLWTAVILHNLVSHDPLLPVEKLLPMLKFYFLHRDPLLRLTAIQIASQMASHSKGASVLVPISGESIEETLLNRIWSSMMDIYLDLTEAGHARGEALDVLNHLLALCTQVLWFGPVMKEPNSGVILNGESALLLFFKSVRFEQFVLQQCRTFGHFHHVPFDDKEDDSIRPSQSSSTSDETCSKHECPTPRLVSKLINFVEQILIVDQKASHRMGESFKSLPQLCTELFPAILSLSFDSSDKQTRQIMSELAPDLNDYAQMFESLLSLLRCCLVNLKNYAYVTMSDNNAVYLSMLISSTHHLWTLNQDPGLASSLFHFLSQLLSGEPDGRLNKMLSKFFPVLVQLSTQNLQVIDASFSTFKTVVFVATLFRYIGRICDSEKRNDLIESLLSVVHDNSSSCIDLCRTLLPLQFSLRKDDTEMLQAINLAIQHLFLVCQESKQFALEYRASDGQSLFSMVSEELDKLLNQLSFFVSGSTRDDPVVLAIWSDVDNFVNLVYNFCTGNQSVKKSLILAEFHKTILHFCTVILASGNQNGSLALKNMLLVVVTNFLSLVATLTAGCPEGKSALATSVTPRLMTSQFQATTPQSLLQVIVDLCKAGESGKENHRGLFASFPESIQTYNYVILPKAFRIVTASLTSVECRSFVIRSRFANDCGEIVTSHSPQSKTSNTIKQQNRTILCLDFLLTLTSFPDGQSWMIKQPELVQKLVDLASHTNESSSNRQTALASLAILRNVGFHPNGRVQLLLDKNVLSLLANLVGVSSSEPVEKIVLSLIWSLGHNNHRAKIVLEESGITKRVREEWHRRELKRRISSGAKNEEDDLMDVVKNVLTVDRPKSLQRK